MKKFKFFNLNLDDKKTLSYYFIKKMNFDNKKFPISKQNKKNSKHR